MSQVFSGKSITVLMGGNSAERAISLKVAAPWQMHLQVRVQS